MDAGFASTGACRGLAVLWLIDSLTMGGAESLAAVFARAAKRDGRIRLHIAFLKRLGGSPLEAVLMEAGIRCTNLGARNLRDIGALLRLVRLVRETRPDVLHAHLTYASIFGAIACRVAGTPFVSTLHVPPTTQPVWSRTRIRESLMCALLRKQGTTVAVSHAQRSSYIDRGLLDPARTIVVHNGIEADNLPIANDHRRALLRRELGLPDEAVVITTVAVLRDRSKGIQVLLQAAQRAFPAGRPVRLLVVGEGPVRTELEAEARRLGVDGLVRWLGQRRDVPALLAGSDIFVLPTLRDQFPTVILEAMAAALPVVSTTVDGVPEIVQHESTGLLVEPNDPDALAGAIWRLIANPSERERLGRAARERVLTRFSESRWVQQLYELYAAESGRAIQVRAAAMVRRAS